MSVEVILAVISVFLFLIWLLSPSEKLKRMGNKIPGPPSYPLVGNSFNFPPMGKKSFFRLMEGMEKYGTVIRVWLGPTLHILLFNPDDIQMLLTSQSLITKSRTYGVLHDWLGTGLLTSTGDLWHRRRKAITPTFHFKILDEFVPVFNKCGDVLVGLLADKCDKGPFNIISYVSNCALDAIAQSAMGVAVDAQIHPNSTYVETIFALTRFLGEKINQPWLGVEPLYTLSGRKSTERNWLGIVKGFSEKVLKEKQDAYYKQKDSDNTADEFGIKKRYAFLEMLLDIFKKNNPAFQKDQDMLDEVYTFMFEGHDTTTAALSFTIWSLGKHPEIQEEVYREVAPILKETDVLRMEDLHKMKYLDRVLKESMRLYPPVPVIGRRIDKDTLLPSGYTLPAGCEVYANFIGMHRNPQFFPDPHKFNPDRFLDDQKHPFAYLPFSAGPRNCIGQKFAMADIKAILSKLVYNYKIKTEKDLTLCMEMVLRIDDGPYVSLTKRS